MRKLPSIIASISLAITSNGLGGQPPDRICPSRRNEYEGNERGAADAVMKLMATVLSPMGLEKVEEIRQADDDFKSNGSRRGPGGRGGPPHGGRDKLTPASFSNRRATTRTDL